MTSPDGEQQADPTAEAVRRIVAAVDPERIILFGSRARGDDRPDSDVDLIIIAASSLPRWRRTVPVYLALAGINVPKDVLWYTPEEWRASIEVCASLPSVVHREGKVIYERPG